MNWLSAVSPFLSWLADASVKGAVVIVLVAILHRLLASRVDARWRHALWLLVLVRFALPAGPSSRLSIFNLLPRSEDAALAVPGQSMIAVAVSSPRVPAVVEVREVAAPWWGGAMRALVVVWLAGALLLALRTLIASVRLHRAVRRALATHPGEAAIDAIVAAECRRLGITRTVRAVECDLVRTPALHGMLRPTLLLPAGISRAFTPEELRHVVLHELWHLRRLDVAVSWILSAVQTLHWFNPFVWFAASRIKEERELSCDELALSFLEEDERLRYGGTILKLLERFRAPVPVPALVGIVNHKQKMKRRLTMIASFRNRPRLTLLFAAAAAVVGLIGLTDAHGGEKRLLRHAGPAMAAHMENRVSFDLTSASLGELLNTVSSKAGITITQSPEVATSSAQQARFTLHADNVPVHAVLVESLAPFMLMPKPEGDGIVIEKGNCALMTKVSESSEDGAQGRTVEKRVIVTDGKEGAVAMDNARIESETAPGTVDKEIVIRKMGGGASCALSKDGTLHRELTLKMNETGVESSGKLTLDIVAPPPASK
jgi:bla regulator protein BlaR1